MNILSTMIGLRRLLREARRDPHDDVERREDERWLEVFKKNEKHGSGSAALLRCIERRDRRIRALERVAGALAEALS